MKPTRAHAAVSKAISLGEMKRQPCEICGNPSGLGHHDNYSKPLVVRWLCSKHHFQWHQQHPEMKSLLNRVLLKLSPETDKLLYRSAAKERITKSEFVERAIRERIERLATK